MGWVYGVGVVFAISAALFHALKLGRLLSGRLTDDELVTVQESEDMAQLEELHLGDSQTPRKH